MEQIFIVFRLMHFKPLAAFKSREMAEKQAAQFEKTDPHAGRYTVKESTLLWDDENNPIYYSPEDVP